MELFKVLQLMFVLHMTDEVFSITTYYLDSKCGKTIDLIIPDQVRLKTRTYDTRNYTDECKVTFSASYSSKLMIYFESLNMGDSSSCIEGRVAIYDGQIRWGDSKPPKIADLCGSVSPDTIYESSDDYVTLTYRSSSGKRPDLDIIVTEFHEGYCYSFETKCDNGKCISDSIACNGYNSCGDDSDCDARNIAIIIGCTVGGVALVIGIVAVVVCIYCMKRKNVGRAGYMANRPVATTMTSANMTTSFGAQYQPPPAYSQVAYGIGGHPQQQQQQQQYMSLVTAPQQHPEQQNVYDVIQENPQQKPMTS